MPNSFWEQVYLARLRRGAGDDEARAAADAAVRASNERRQPTRWTLRSFHDGWPKWFKAPAAEIAAAEDLAKKLGAHARQARLGGAESCECKECSDGYKFIRRILRTLDEACNRERAARSAAKTDGQSSAEKPSAPEQR